MPSSTPTSILSRAGDEHLVALVRVGRADAFAEIDARYRGPLLGYARRMLGGSDDAEDVVQDALAKAHRSLIASDRAIALHAWLYAIVRNRALDVLRSPKRGHAELGEDVTPALESTVDPFTRVVERDELRGVVAAILALPDRQRAALVLRELDGLSYDEVAGRLDITLPATKSLLVRARANLAEARAAA
jgi:RNA polymerase sigma-70 factor, ECF subfamily